MGILEANGAVPFSLYISDEDEQLFQTLTNENVHMNIKNVDVDFVE